MITPGGPAFSIALELLPTIFPWRCPDAELYGPVYTTAEDMRTRTPALCQAATLALPAIPGTVVDHGDKGSPKVRTYPSANGTYVGVAYKEYARTKRFTVKVSAKAGAKVILTS